MKNRDLIAMLLHLDQDLEVCIFHDIGAMLVNEHVDVYQGLYEDPDNEKCIFKRIEGKFIGIGNPSDFDNDNNDYEIL
jgi:hypothetical protein